MRTGIQAIALEAVWARMITITNEIGTTLARTAFSTLLREGLDYSAGVFDSEGNMLAQGNAAATGHIGSMPYVAKTYLQVYPAAKLAPGDIIIANDPWIGAGQTNDVYIAAPIHKNSRFLGMVVVSAHQVDIGGRLASTESREVYEEGLRIPVIKLYKAGVPVEEVFQIIHNNVRMADMVVGDITAQVAAAQSGVAKVLDAMQEYRLDSLDALAEEIVRRTDQNMRGSIKLIPDGQYRAEMTLEEADQRGNPLHIKLTVDVNGDELIVDFDGTSPQVDKAINCVLNYTRAYAVLGVKLALNPTLPNNEGTYRAIKVCAPEGSILNCRFPAAVHFRHIMGLRLPELVFLALAPAIPKQILAGSGGTPVWLYTLTGLRRTGERFIISTHAMGGLGARYSKDGMSAVTFPANIRDIPTEVIENETPALIQRRELVCDSAGPGRYRGGLGEELVIGHVRDADVLSESPITVPVFPGRLKFRSPGLNGGKDGPLGRVLINGVPSPNPSGQNVDLYPGDTLTLVVPGGAGQHNPFERDPAAVVDDVRNGYVSLEQARLAYAVVVDPATLTADLGATERLRSTMRGT